MPKPTFSLDTANPNAPQLTDPTGAAYPFELNGRAVALAGALWNPDTMEYEAQRTPSKFVYVSSFALVANTPTPLWLPTQGKRFRLLGCIFYSITAASLIVLADGAGQAAPGFAVTWAGVPSATQPAGPDLVLPGNGYLSTQVNNPLSIESQVNVTLFGSLWGCEE